MHTSSCLIGIEARFVHFVRLLLTIGQARAMST